MFAEWSAECAADDPLLVVPWGDQDPGPRFIDLREDPYNLDQLPEAESHPPLMQALRALNAPRSPVFTAKCDAWPLSLEEAQQLAFELMLPPEDNPAGFASYIDLVPRERFLFASFHQQEQLLSRLTRRAEALDHPHAALDCIIRPALIDLTGPQEGWSISLYTKALGPDPETAWQRWSAALEDTVATLRGKDFSPA